MSFIVSTLARMDLLSSIMDIDDDLEDLLLLMMIYEYEQLHPSKRKALETEMTEALTAWTEVDKLRIKLTKLSSEAMQAKFGASKLKIEAAKAKCEASSSSSHEASNSLSPFSLINCMRCLEAIEGVDGNTYLKVLQIFKAVDWREMFMAMSDERRRLWMASWE